MEKPLLGLKRLRNSPARQPTLCTNCKCLRYAPCGCERKQDKRAKEPVKQ